jgi:multidrug efflux pump
LVSWSVDHARTVLLALLVLLAMGAAAYVTIAKEANPEVDIPIFFVTVPYPGVSAADAERLMLRPLERELQGIAGVDELQSWAGEGFALVRLDFEPGTDNDKALADVREEVDSVAPELPQDAQEPDVREVDLSLFPVLTVNLSGPMDERTLIRVARNLRDRIEALPGVLEVDIGGDREEMMEVLADPLVLESYALSYQEVTGAIRRNNQLIAAGAVDTGAGRVPLRVPGTIDGPQDVRDTAIRVDGDAVVTVADVAEVRSTYQDPEGFTRINGQPSVSLEISKATGGNILDVVARARATIEREVERLPDSLEVTYLQDGAKDVEDLLGDLENNVITAVIIVALVILGAMGLRLALLVGIAIPGAFLTGILVLWLTGFTLNIVVLFALILVVGMLVDGAVVVGELADRYLAQGMDKVDAFRSAAQRMLWPITAGVATTLAVFAPMTFWPGMVGEFIVYLPLTVIITLTASLAMALIFVPTLGAVFGSRRAVNAHQVRQLEAAEQGDFDRLDGFTARYVRAVRSLAEQPWWSLAAVLGLLALSYLAYAVHGRGVEFFPEIEPDFVQIQVQARGDLSVWEADALVKRVESRVRDIPEIDAIYARTIGTQLGRLEGDYAEDVIGVIQLELTPWRTRGPASAVIDRIRGRTADVPGLRIQVRAQQRGPTSARPIRIEVRGEDPEQITTTVQHIRATMERLGGFVDMEDDLPLPGIDLDVQFDREQAARFGIDVPLLGQGVQLLTDGLLLGTWRPAHADEEVDIRMRLPADKRHLQELANRNLPGADGLVPLANFAELVPVPSTGLIKRRDGQRAHTIVADVGPGLLVDDRVELLRQQLDAADLPEDVRVRFRGETEDQAEASEFLGLAFGLALLLMLGLMVTQFNRFDQACLVLTAILFSTAGVLLALLIRGEPFSIVMSGIGVLALAGIVVNNNIVLIDTYNEKRADGLVPMDAALRTAALRLRPVVLTAVTTILGLTPMVLGWTVDFVGRDFHIGAPSTDYWVQLATGVAGGLLFATPITLLLTPAMLVLLDRSVDRAGPQRFI